MTGLDDNIFDDGAHEVRDDRDGGPHPTRAERRRGRRERGRRPPDAARGGGRRRGASCLAVLLAGALVLAAGWFALGSLRSLLPGWGESDDYAGPGSGKVEVVIDSGASGAVIGQTLQEADVVKTTSSFTAVARAEPEQAASIQPGTYVMRQKMSATDAFDRLLDPANRVAKGVTLREGLWRSEIYERLSEGTDVPVEEYEQAEESEELELPPQAEGEVEGWLFPSTYEFADDASAVQQMNTMISQTVSQLEEAGVPKDEWERTLTVASIVEGEAGAADRRKVARVVENRLDDPAGPTRGMLQMDSTVHYLLQKRGTITTSDKERNTDSPYNTYTNQGLPPGPINNPGAAAIDAAGNPAEGDWLFFVTVDPSTGETKFAETQAEHERNVQEFCRNTGSCE
ncbi:endolytic transglycosylase MltG [Janibacter alittae]|uniref:Endolytic murein transglycosylase n=1 Tax=Janibacter alittae TaxID=3115209 RepID=A0ABZ2MDK6_9MICO